MKPTTNQKRFLIIWILFHSFALFVNLAHINGEISFNNNKDVSSNIITERIDSTSMTTNEDLDRAINELNSTKSKSNSNLSHVGDYDTKPLPNSDRSTVIRDAQHTVDNTIFLFTNELNPSDFWPFTKFYFQTFVWEDFKYPEVISEERVKKPQTSEERYLDSITKTYPSTPIAYSSLKTKVGEQNIYGGIFNSYNIPEYIFYMILGFGIVFIPMFWKNNKEEA